MPDPEIEHVQALVDRAKHDSVAPERLANKKIGFKRYRLHDKPLYNYLHEQEQPHFLFHADREKPEFNGPNAPDPIQSSLRYKVMHLITDRRWLMVAGNTEGDQVCEIALEAIEATNHESGGRLRNNTFVVELENAHISVPMANDYTEEDLQTLSRYLRDQVGAVRGGVAVDSDEANYTISGDDTISYSVEDVRNRLDQLPDEAMESANEVVADAETVDELIPRLDNLMEEYEDDEQTLDDVVRKADSADELRRDPAVAPLDDVLAVEPLPRRLLGGRRHDVVVADEGERVGVRVVGRAGEREDVAGVVALDGRARLRSQPLLDRVARCRLVLVGGDRDEPLGQVREFVHAHAGRRHRLSASLGERSGRSARRGPDLRS